MRRSRNARRRPAKRVLAELPLRLGVTHWYDGRQGASASSWTSRTSSATISQGTAANQPVLTTIGAGTHPALQFDGTDDSLTLGATKWNLGNDAVYSLVMYLQPALAYTTTRYAWGVIAGGYHVLGSALAAGNYYYGHTNDNAPVTGSWGTTAQTVAVTFDAGRNSQIYANGSPVGTPFAHSASPAGAVVNGGICVSPGFGTPWGGKVAHCMIFEGQVLSQAEITSLSTYLAGICA